MMMMMTYAGFSVHVKIASRVVSYNRIVSLLQDSTGVADGRGKRADREPVSNAIHAASCQEPDRQRRQLQVSFHGRFQKVSERAFKEHVNNDNNDSNSSNNNNDKQKRHNFSAQF